ncbi:TadE/TadG family type IV pilus assembly protein [Nocardiopsis sp. CC223A]|uniref:TadE/TadG family type IV pilus assembly protein n=1 Tax=Nocardiopsis sp. CC223A TaxID=3044051 RepID=UPI00278BD9AC|nr:TadE/TadG family type IV pilus assembly protein [Nocardiopsis sp. CC223A]
MGGDDRGSAEPLFVLPLVFVMVLAVAQVGLWAHAQHRVQVIAAQALAAARSFDGTVHQAREQAARAEEQLGGGILQGTEVEVERRPEAARVRVSGRAVSLVPGVGVPVSSEVTGPVERLVP